MAQLYFYYSAMNAGKSTALLQSSYNYQERGMRTVVYTAEIDDRFGAGKVSSRIGLSSPAKLFNQNCRPEPKRPPAVAVPPGLSPCLGRGLLRPRNAAGRVAAGA